MTPPSFKIADDWKWVLRHRWEVRLILLAALITGAETAVPLVTGFFPIPPTLYALLMFVLTVSGFVTRLVVQKVVEDK